MGRERDSKKAPRWRIGSSPRMPVTPPLFSAPAVRVSYHVAPLRRHSYVSPAFFPFTPPCLRISIHRARSGAIAADGRSNLFGWNETQGDVFSGNEARARGSAAASVQPGPKDLGRSARTTGDIRHPCPHVRPAQFWRERRQAIPGTYSPGETGGGAELAHRYRCGVCVPFFSTGREAR